MTAGVAGKDTLILAKESMYYILFLVEVIWHTNKETKKEIEKKNCYICVFVLGLGVAHENTENHKIEDDEEKNKNNRAGDIDKDRRKNQKERKKERKKEK